MANSEQLELVKQLAAFDREHACYRESVRVGYDMYMEVLRVFEDVHGGLESIVCSGLENDWEKTFAAAGEFCRYELAKRLDVVYWAPMVSFVVMYMTKALMELRVESQAED